MDLESYGMCHSESKRMRFHERLVPPSDTWVNISLSLKPGFGSRMYRHKVVWYHPPQQFTNDEKQFRNQDNSHGFLVKRGFCHLPQFTWKHNLDKMFSLYILKCWQPVYTYLQFSTLTLEAIFPRLFCDPQDLPPLCSSLVLDWKFL